MRIFSLPEEMGPQRKTSVVDTVSVLFIGLLHLPAAWKVLFDASKVSQMISFGDGSVRFVLPCVWFWKPENSRHTTPPFLRKT